MRKSELEARVAELEAQLAAATPKVTPAATPAPAFERPSHASVNGGRCFSRPTFFIGTKKAAWAVRDALAGKTPLFPALAECANLVGAHPWAVAMVATPRGDAYAVY